MEALCPADLLIENVTVITMDPQLPKAFGIAIAKDKIIGLLPSSSSSWPLTPTGLRMNGNNLVILPGLIDAHCHLRALLSQNSAVSCTSQDVRSIADILKVIHTETLQVSTNTWIRAFGYDVSQLDENRHPTRYDLDKVALEHPVRLRHVTRHVSILNSVALNIAGIGAYTSDPPGMHIERNPENNEPTGMIHGGDAWLSQHIIPNATFSELQKGVSNLQTRLLKYGITAIQDATPTNRLEDAKFWHAAIHDNWPITIQMMTDYKHHDEVAAYIKKELPTLSREKLEIGHIKVVMEALPEIVPTLDNLSKLGQDAFERDGSSLAIHVVDPEMTWTAIEAIRQIQSAFPNAHHQHRFEHLSLSPEAFLPDIAALGIRVVTNPSLIYDHGDRYLADVEPSEYEWLYRMQSLHEAGIAMAAGSDAPVASLNPWLGIQTACTRKTSKQQTVNSTEALDPWNALHLYTAGAAEAAGWQNKRGMIKPGFQADLVAVNQNPLTYPIDNLHSISVKATWIAGKLVFSDI